MEKGPGAEEAGGSRPLRVEKTRGGEVVPGGGRRSCSEKPEKGRCDLTASGTLSRSTLAKHKSKQLKIFLKKL